MGLGGWGDWACRLGCNSQWWNFRGMVVCGVYPGAVTHYVAAQHLSTISASRGHVSFFH